MLENRAALLIPVRHCVLRRATCTAVAIALAAMLGGCKPAENVATQAPPRDPAFNNATPQAAVAELVRFMRANLSAVARHDRAAARAARDQIAWHVLDRDRVLATISGRADPASAAGAAILAHITESWIATLAYYANVIDPAEFTVDALSDTEVDVRVPAERDGRVRQLRFTCTSTATGWRLRGIDIRPLPAEPTASRPSPATSSAPATAPHDAAP